MTYIKVYSSDVALANYMLGLNTVPENIKSACASLKSCWEKMKPCPAIYLSTMQDYYNDYLKKCPSV
jgi:hypothetical protein